MLRVGTDCSGIESPIEALIQLGIRHKHVFSSEINKYCIQSIVANYTPEIIFGDIMDRNINDVPDIDLYICGFPCQPFSMLGNRKGVQDTRGTIFERCLEVIKIKSPIYFILENVQGLLSVGKRAKPSKNLSETFQYIINTLENIGEYKVYWKVLNTSDFGLPQNRKRIYIIGTKKTFEWPKPIKCKNLKNFVDKTDNSTDVIPKRFIYLD